MQKSNSYLRKLWRTASSISQVCFPHFEIELAASSQTGFFPEIGTQSKTGWQAEVWRLKLFAFKLDGDA
jgi:hypothetical protein